MSHFALRFVFAALLVVLGFGTALAQQAAEPSRAPTPGIDAPPAPAANVSDYIIGPGDTLQIFMWRNPELSVSVPVRPDGKISKSCSPE